MAKNKLILFDVDNTLFDSQKYIHTFSQAIAKRAGLADVDAFLKVALQVYMETRKLGTFDPDIFAPRLAQSAAISLGSEEIKQIIFDDKLIASCLFPETLQVLEKLYGKDIVLGIFSSGRKDLQLLKMQQFHHLLEDRHIHVTTISKESSKAYDSLKQYADQAFEIYIVDDLLHVLVKVKEILPLVKTIWAKQGRHTFSQERVYVPDYEIEDLTGLEKIVTH